MNQCVVFDMDGTLVNSFEGIFYAYQWAFKKLSIPFPGEAFVRQAVGAPLLLVFEKSCGMDGEKARLAARHYREYYAEKGRYQAVVYPGMEETLCTLKDAGCFLGVATLKKEGFAREMLRSLGLLPHLNAVCGMDEQDSLTKAGLIRRCMDHAGADTDRTVLVGDSEFEALGAEEAGVSFLAVTYGFGFHNPETRERYHITRWADSPADIPRLLF